MNRKIGALLLLMIFVAAWSCVKIDEIENVKLKTEAVTADFIQAMGQKDADQAAELFSRSAEAALFDPVNDSLVLGFDHIKTTLSTLLAQVDSVKIQSVETHVFPGQDLSSSRIAAIYKVIVQKAGRKAEFLTLVSGYLEKSGAAWRFVQLQASVRAKADQKISTTKKAAFVPQKEADKPKAVAKPDSLVKATPDTLSKSY